MEFKNTTKGALSPREMELACLVWQCFKSEPQVGTNFRVAS